MNEREKRKHEENWAAIIKAATEMSDPKGMVANVVLAVDSLQKWAGAMQNEMLLEIEILKLRISSPEERQP